MVVVALRCCCVFVVSIVARFNFLAAGLVAASFIHKYVSSYLLLSILVEKPLKNDTFYVAMKISIDQLSAAETTHNSKWMTTMVS